MATIRQNNIDFTNVQNSNIFTANGKYSVNANADDSGKFDTTLTGDEITKSFNAVEIDWNGALVDNNTTINSTGDLLNWIKTKGGSGPGPGPGPLNPDEPTDSSPSIVTLTLNEFNEKKENGLLEEKILYIVVDAGKILFMYQIINGREYLTYMPEPSLLKETGTTTLDNFNNLPDSEKASKNWIITDENGNKIGIALEGVLLLDAKIEEAEVDGVGYKVMIVDSYPPEKVLSNILYLVKDNNGKITTSYLNDNEIELEKVNGLQKSEVTEMFKKDFVKDNQGNIIGLKHTGISIDKNGDGEIIESTEFNSYLNDYTNKAGFISNTDDGKAFALLFATSSTKGKLKSSEIIAAINKNPQGGETSSVTISADKIDVNGILNVRIGSNGEQSNNENDKKLSQLLVTADGLSSRVSGLDDNDNLVVSNFNSEKGEITLTTIMTPAQGNTAAQTASINLKVNSKDEGSKLTLTADQIELNGEKTIALWLGANAISAGTLDAHLGTFDLIKSKISETGYIIIENDPAGNDPTVTTLTTKGMYFAQNRNWVQNLKENGEWAAWTTDLENRLKLHNASQYNYDGLSFYSEGTAGNSTSGIELKAGSFPYLHFALLGSDDNVTYIDPGRLLFIKGPRIFDNNSPLYNNGFFNWLTADDYLNSNNRRDYINISLDGIQIKNNNHYINLGGANNNILFENTQANNDNRVEIRDGFLLVVNDNINLLVTENSLSIINTNNSKSLTFIKDGSIILSDGLGHGVKLYLENGKLALSDDIETSTELEENNTSIFTIGEHIKYDNELGILKIGPNVDEASSCPYLKYDDNNNCINFHSGVIYGLNNNLGLSAMEKDTTNPNKRASISLDTNKNNGIIKISAGDYVNLETNLIVDDELTVGGYSDNKRVRIGLDSVIIDDNCIGKSVFNTGFDSTGSKAVFQAGPITINKDTEDKTKGLFGIVANDFGGGHPSWHIYSKAEYGLSILATHSISLTGDDINFNGLVNLSSDQNLKNIISDISLTVEQIANAPAINFSWKTDKNNNVHIGTTALYWQEILPEVVHENNEGTLGLEYSTTALVSSIIEAKEVVVLKSKVEELEAENNRLKIRLAQIEEKLGL